MKLILFLSFVIHVTTSQSSHSRRQSCGYDSCPTTFDDYLNIHIVCHTHLDTGWVQTYDDYYQRNVRMIYDSVIQTLLKVPNRKFIAVETSFFSKWFNEQNHTIQNRVQGLVRNGQLEFINGGWSMNDEAAAHYSAIIDQLTLGHRWLNKTFGECAIPRIGWQIDPFGHSREQASIFAQMGFDGMFLGRIDYQDKLLRERTRTLEFLWKSSPSLGKKADIFTGVLPNLYFPPNGFCFDVNCYNEPITTGNAKQKSLDFIGIARNQALKYGTNHTVFTMGLDFFYRNADNWYQNLDRLMNAINAMQSTQKVNIIYSSPSCYLKSLNQINRTWPIKQDDFFPYADIRNSYWTGYFTSRPSLKYLIKNGNNLIQSAKQLSVLSRMSHILSPKLSPLQEALGILQHHDAVTGTCKQAVNDDYIRIMSKAMSKAQEAVVDSYYYLLQSRGLVSNSSGLSFCNNLNISECPITEAIDNSSQVVVTIYNPLAHPVKHYARLPVRNFNLRVKDVSGGLIPSQVVPISPWIMSLPERKSMAEKELIFESLLPPLGFTSVLVDTINSDQQNLIRSQGSRVTDGSVSSRDIILVSGKIGIKIDGKTGLLKEVIFKNGQIIPITQNFWYYTGGDRSNGEKPSGAYAFNPSQHIPIPISNTSSYKIIRGRLVDEVHQTFKPWVHQIIRLYKNFDYLEFEWTVGPIPIGNHTYKRGLEIVTRYDSNFQNNGMFYTDSNSRETIRRIRDFRPTWHLETTEPVASNYYPITSWAYIRDNKQDLQMTVLTDRSEGGTSLADGSLEIMLHRRLIYDDDYGVHEALNEPGFDNKGLIVRGKHRFIINVIRHSIRQMRTMSKTLTWKPIPLFKRSTGSKLRSSSHPYDYMNFVGISHLLPKNIHLLTLEPWDYDLILIRLEHFYEINEDSEYSAPTDVSLRSLFTTFRIINVKEMSLSVTQDWNQSQQKRMKWSPDFDPYTHYKSVNENTVSQNNGTDNPFIVTLRPMQIKTFLLKVEYRTVRPLDLI